MHNGQIELEVLEHNADQNNSGLLPFMIVVPLTARLIVMSICLFFFTMCRVFHNKLVDWTSNIPGIDFSDAANVIYRGHKVSGPSQAFPMSYVLCLLSYVLCPMSYVL
jgi:hypothetical protein